MSEEFVGSKGFSTNEESVTRIVGRVLTMIDSAMPEGAQCDSLKSLVKQEIWSLCHWAYLDESGRGAAGTGELPVEVKDKMKEYSGIPEAQ